MFYLKPFCMWNKIKYLIVIFVVLFQTFTPNFLFVSASSSANGGETKQPEVCSTPSHMMQLYFDFQDEVVKIIWGTEMSSSRLSTSLGSWWLFTEWTLTLNSDGKSENKKDNKAMDTIKSSVESNVVKVASTASSVVLLMMAASSVVTSNLEWWAVLFRDAPIVRDYKKMLDIQSNLFEAAYLRSKELILTRQFESQNFYNEFNSLIKKYQDEWLFEKWARIKEVLTLADILKDMVNINATMKYFLVNVDTDWEDVLYDWAWCLWNWDTNTTGCWRGIAVLKFSQDAIDQLVKDYGWLWVYGACNLSTSSFKNSLNKTFDNNGQLLKDSGKDIGESFKRLYNALVWVDKSVDDRKNGINCEDSDFSAYELAQLRAYYWPDWSCSSTLVVNGKEFVRNKSLQSSQAGWEITVTDKSQSDKRKLKDTFKDWWKKAKEWTDDMYRQTLESINEWLKLAKDTQERNRKWKEVFWSWNVLNTYYSFDLYEAFSGVYVSVFEEFESSQFDAASADMRSELIQLLWLMDQVDEASKAIWSDNDAKWLKKSLKDIAEYQCSE